MDELPLQTSQFLLPKSFPKGITPAKFSLGDRVSWRPLPSQDFGIITGLQYSPAEHSQSWQWQYVVWLDPLSPSRAWVHTDLAWEEDLQLDIPPSDNPPLEGEPE